MIFHRRTAPATGSTHPMACAALQELQWWFEDHPTADGTTFDQGPVLGCIKGSKVEAARILAVRGDAILLVMSMDNGAAWLPAATFTGLIHSSEIEKQYLADREAAQEA